MEYAKKISIRGIKTNHIQGIAVDKERKYIYSSFTTCLVKTDMEGNIIGTVKGLAGHLGCIAYNYDDGRVYGSLEFKHDQIGAGLIKESGLEDVEDGFYIAIFDVSKIDRMDMDAEKDGIMTAVFLKEVTEDYKVQRFGSGGIDGTTFAPIAGSSDSKKYLHVAYGIYSDLEREDNDHQIILRYDISDWKKYEKSLDQANMHRQGPDKPDSKYFVYTGNTTFGVQNLEYVKEQNAMLAAVYIGGKEKFPNYPMYVIDMAKKAEINELKGKGEKGEELFLKETTLKHEETGICGIEFPYGATGICSLGDNFFYFSQECFEEGKGWGSDIVLYKYDGVTFIEV